MKEPAWKLDIGASIIDGRSVRFRVWAPLQKKVAVRVAGRAGVREIPLSKEPCGYFGGIGVDVFPSDHYVYVLGENEARPDPASRFQPEGVHGPSEVVDPLAFTWGDDGWTGVLLKDFIIYELHVGTFTKEGTFDAIMDYVDYLRDLGVTAVEVMPVSQFPGTRNWGYDGACPFAPQNSYGGPGGFKRLIDACHRKGLAVILDVVYNHLGPEGNYLGNFGPYLTNRYRTPWGDAINFDGPLSDHVRHYFVSNALYWLTEYHIDALRLDAVQGIFDFSARHFLRDLSDEVRSLGQALAREVYIIAESDLNDVRIIDEPAIGGYGVDAQWSDDFHHSLHTLLTGETRAYYKDFGKLSHMAKALSEGFVYSGQYSAHRNQRHGNSSKGRPASQFVVFSQNHDQTGNNIARPDPGESLEQLKLAAGMVLLSPYIPLLFMGEEYAEQAPFHYFVSYGDPALVEAVRESRKEEFIRLWQKIPADPGAEKTFLDSKIHVRGRRSLTQEKLFRFYKRLIQLRKENPVLATPAKEQIEVRKFDDGKTLYVRRWSGKDSILCLCNFENRIARITFTLSEKGTWIKVLDSSAVEWGGKGESAPQLITFDKGEVVIDSGPYGLVLYRAGSEEA